MAGGPIFPSSVYLGAASGNLSPTVYVPTTNTNGAGAIEGIGVVASLGANATAVLQYNLPETIPTGTAKLIVNAWANATSGTAVLIASDGQTAVGGNLGTTTLTANATYSTAWTAADAIVQTKITISTVPTANEILTVAAAFMSTSWTLAAASVWQISLVWE